MTDPDSANADQYAAWNGESGRRWTADPDRRDRMVATVADALLAAAGLTPGERVLDIGCGCGAPTLAAAGHVAPAGVAQGIDLSEPMLDVARRRSELAGVTNVRFEHGDAQTDPLPVGFFDVAISRFGTMFFADPVAAFANVARALRTGGRLCIATWQPLAANDWLTIPGAALLRYGSLPDLTDGPGMFAQSEPDVVVATLTAAGYEAIVLAPAQVTLRLGADPLEVVEHLADIGPARVVLDTIPEPDRPAALDAVRSVLAEHHSPDGGVQLDAAIWITTASKAG